MGLNSHVLSHYRLIDEIKDASCPFLRVVNTFKNRQASETFFYWDIQLDSWKDGRLRIDYSFFGDVVSFDIIY